MYYDFMETEKGTLIIAADQEGVCHIEFVEAKRPLVIGDDWQRSDQGLVKETKRQLQDYFDGRLREFDLPLNPTGTEFQKRVWTQLCRIPHGKTISYSQLAEAIGKPSAGRAVGAANGRNPISIVVPCHRVIGKNGSLTGYAGGLEAKSWLLEHERATLGEK